MLIIHPGSDRSYNCESSKERFPSDSIICIATQWRPVYAIEEYTLNRVHLELINLGPFLLGIVSADHKCMRQTTCNGSNVIPSYQFSERRTRAPCNNGVIGRDHHARLLGVHVGLACALSLTEHQGGAVYVNRDAVRAAAINRTDTAAGRLQKLDQTWYHFVALLVVTQTANPTESPGERPVLAVDRDGVIVTAAKYLPSVLWPRAPYSGHPNECRPPLMSRIIENSAPHPTFTIGGPEYLTLVAVTIQGSFLPTPHWPSLLSPAAKTIPRLVKNKVWLRPHDAPITVCPFKASTSVGSSRRFVSPTPN
ncbi:hypothetical protein DBV15_04021 [Temnothorax longispinosus]|uniref:Uncharacterized protein n=1 Tax=Temnothorax longispinosus TaxID=300112 RepID=A0A4S2LB63_9HYME|nr:hypothetical protein DBV15_04021 [Temnothorax longispinosus]